MHTDNINSCNFRAIRTPSLQNAFFNRIGNPKRYIEYSYLEASQITNPFNINISMGKNKKLIANITNENGDVLYTKKENPISALLNINPVGFIRKVCERANKFNTEKICNSSDINIT